MLTLEQLRAKVDSHDIDTLIVAFTDHYGRLLGKRFDADFFLTEIVAAGSHACDYLLTTDMEMEPVPGYSLANWELGYGDFHLIPDWSTLRHISWQNKTALVLCNLENEKIHQPVAVAPRSVLLKQLSALEQAGFASKAASELEYYLLSCSYRQAHDQNYHQLPTSGWYLEDYHILQGTRTEQFTGAVRRHLKNSGLRVENSKGEWGLGQHEINIHYADTLAMADQHMVFKQCLKEIADQMGLAVTFMAKYRDDGAGSSCHLHLSLWQNGLNVFPGPHQLGPVMGSDIFRWFLGGWIAHVPDVMPFYAPTINAYKRYVDNSWAPTRLAWSYDNRTAGFRVVGRGPSLRIECRIPGADCNPYLAFAAALASGLDGIRNQIEPPPIFTGDIYAAKSLPRVPYTLEKAVQLFKDSKFSRQVFGAEVIDHYTHFYSKEVEAYNFAVTDWERRRYFERI